MMRKIGGAALGFWNLATFACFSLLWFALGADGSFQPGSWEVSGAWAAAALAVYLLSGGSAGFTAAKVGRGLLGPAILLVLVAAMGVYAAVVGGAGVDPRPDDVSIFDAGGDARYPAWAAWLNAFVGPLGVLCGACKARRRAEAEGDASYSGAE